MAYVALGLTTLYALSLAYPWFPISLKVTLGVISMITLLFFSIIRAICEPFTPPCSPSCSFVSPLKVYWFKVSSADAGQMTWFPNVSPFSLKKFQSVTHLEALDLYTHSLI